MLSEECILFGYPGEEDIIQVVKYCVLLTKYLIYTNKVNGNITLKLYTYLVLLKRTNTFKRTFVPTK